MTPAVRMVCLVAGFVVFEGGALVLLGASRGGLEDGKIVSCGCCASGVLEYAGCTVLEFKELVCEGTPELD